MSTAKERYYDLKGIADKCFEGVRDPIHDYVIELEQEKAELVEFVKEMNDLGKLSPMRLSDYTDVIYHESLALLNKHTDKHDALQALKKDHPEFGGKK